MKGLVIILPLLCVLVQCNKENCSGKTNKRDDIFSPDEVADMQNLFQQTSHTDDEISAAFPVMDAFKEHSLFSHDELKDATQSDYQYNGDQVQDAVEAALRRLHKKRVEYEKVLNENTADEEPSIKPDDDKKSTGSKDKTRLVAMIDKVVEKVINSGGKPKTKNKKATFSKEESSDEEEKSSDESSSSTRDKKIHHRLAEITAMEEKLSHLIREVKKNLGKKKSEMQKYSGSADLNDDIERILRRNAKKRSDIPHVGTLEKFRKNPHLVDKYIASILSESENTQQGDQRDLLGKKDMDVALLKQAVPGEFDSVPISRLDQESERMESMATDRGMARDVLVESPFSVLDVKKETGKKFRHNLS